MEFPLDKWIAGQTDRKELTREQIKQKFEAQNGRCMYCGHKLNEANMVVDHKISRKNDGSESPANKQLTCSFCNRLKSSMNDKPFRRRYGLDPDTKSPPARTIPYSYFVKIRDSRVRAKKRDPYGGY